MTGVISDKTKDYLEKNYGKKLAESEALDYKNRLVKFFSLLIEIDQRNKKKSNETKAV